MSSRNFNIFSNFPFSSRNWSKEFKISLSPLETGKRNSGFSFSSRNWTRKFEISLSPLETRQRNSDFSFSSRMWRNCFYISLTLLDWAFYHLVNDWSCFWNRSTFTFLLGFCHPQHLEFFWGGTSQKNTLYILESRILKTFHLIKAGIHTTEAAATHWCNHGENLILFHISHYQDISKIFEFCSTCLIIYPKYFN